MTIAEALAEIDRLVAQNRFLSGQIEILRGELHTARAAASL